MELRSACYFRFQAKVDESHGKTEDRNPKAERNLKPDTPILSLPRRNATGKSAGCPTVASVFGVRISFGVRIFREAMPLKTARNLVA